MMNLNKERSADRSTELSIQEELNAEIKREDELDILYEKYIRSKEYDTEKR